jgi:deazaflavin-dependent oxidoreductase (nitroreductase family)
LRFDLPRKGDYVTGNAPEMTYDEQVIEEFRARGGIVGGRHEGRPLIILTTTGARSGQPRETPLVYGQDGGDLFIIASAGGSPSHPAWYHNLLANPVVGIEVGTERYQALASPVTGEERARFYGRLAARFAFFRDYAETTAREIPVVRLERIQG